MTDRMVCVTPTPATASRFTRLVAASSLAMLIAYAAFSIVIVAGDTDEIEGPAARYFSQSWRLFAPNIRSSNTQVEVQALVATPDGSDRTEWEQVSDLELTAVRGQLSPSRIAKSTWNLGPMYTTRLNALGADARALVVESPDDSDATLSTSELAELVFATEGETEAARRYTRVDEMLTDFASAYAMAHFGDDVTEVRWRVATERVPAFVARFRDDEPESWVVTSGWRAVEPAPTGTVEAFRDVIARYGQ